MRKLSPKGLRVLELRAAGLTVDQIAAQYHLSRSTVQAHISKTYTRLDAQSLIEALARVRTVHPEFVMPAGLEWAAPPDEPPLPAPVENAAPGAKLHIQGDVDGPQINLNFHISLPWGALDRLLAAVQTERKRLRRQIKASPGVVPRDSV